MRTTTKRRRRVLTLSRGALVPSHAHSISRFLPTPDFPPVSHFFCSLYGSRSFAAGKAHSAAGSGACVCRRYIEDIAERIGMVPHSTKLLCAIFEGNEDLSARWVAAGMSGGPIHPAPSATPGFLVPLRNRAETLLFRRLWGA